MLLLFGSAMAYGQYADHVVISEIYGGGGNANAPYKNDFIELYNPTASPVSLEGWSVQYASAAGSTWQATPLAGSIPAFGFFLVQEAQGTAGAADVPAPDARGSINMSATAGKVALVNAAATLTGANPAGGTTVVDFVGFGSSATGYEGGGPSPAPSNTNSIERKATAGALGNAHDTDNNAADLTAHAPDPQNSASAVEIDPTPHAVKLPRINLASGSDLTITWRAPVGKFDGVIVLMRSALPVVTVTPAASYASIAGANADYSLAADAGAAGYGSAGDKLIYKGSETEVTVTRLVKNITYHVSILTASGEQWSSGVVQSETALPVELVSFTACAGKKRVELAWTTASEVNNAGFGVEKKTAEGAWNTIAFVEGHGTVHAPQQYAYIDRSGSGKYFYRLKQTDLDGTFEYSRQVEAEVCMSPEEYTVLQNFPNPFNPATTIRFALKEEQQSKLVVFDLLGEELAVLFDGVARGNTVYSVEFNGKAYSSGTYFYRLETAGGRTVKKMSLLK